MSSPAPGTSPAPPASPAPTTNSSPPIISTPPVAILSPPPPASSSPPPAQSPPPQTAPPPAASSPPPPAAQSPPPPAQSAPPPAAQSSPPPAAQSSPPPPVATSPPATTAPPASPPPVAPAQSPPPPSNNSDPPTTAASSPPPPSNAGSSPPPPSDSASSPPPPSDSSVSSPPPPSNSASSPPPDSSPFPPQPTDSPPPHPSKKKSPPPPADASSPPPPVTARPPLDAPPNNAPPTTVLSPPAPAPPVTSTPTPPSNTTSPSLALPGAPPSPSSVPSNGVPSPPSPGEPQSSSSAVSSTAVIGIAVGGIAFLAVIALVCLCLSRKRSRGNKHGNSEDFRTAPSFYNKDAYYDSERGARFDSGYSTSSDVMGKPFFPPAPPPSSLGHVPTVRGQGSNNSSFSYEELAQATSGFSRANMLGEGGFGCVYKGVLSGGQEVAVKQLKVGGGQGEREFRAEVEIITRIHHRHLVTLVGYCIAETQRLLVYEFVPNGTLEHHLYGNEKPMVWSMRMKIAVGSARGLAYLHEDCHPKIIHRDIKSSNILLDNNFEAQVADFGLAKLASDTHTHVTTRVMGTFGYLAPEYASSGKLTDKSDVYSFGVVLLELITGRKPVDTSQPLGEESLVEWSRPLISQALETGNLDCLADPLLNDYNREEMHRMIRAAGASVRHAGNKRPKMSQIVRLLESDDADSRPGFSGLHDSPFASQEYDTAQYSSDMRRFRKMALGTSQEYGSDYSGATSDYGVNPSISSGEFQSKEWTGRQTPQGRGNSDESEWPLRSRQL